MRTTKIFCPVSYTTRQCFRLEIYVYSRQLQLGIAKKSAGDNNPSLIDDVLYYLTNADNDHILRLCAWTQVKTCTPTETLSLKIVFI